MMLWLAAPALRWGLACTLIAPMPPDSPDAPSSPSSADETHVRDYQGPRRVVGPSTPPAAEPSAPAPDAMSPVVPTEEPDDYDPMRHGAQALAARHWIVGGVLFLSAGTVLGAGSLALGLSDPCAPAAGNSCQKAARTRAAWTMAVPAIALLGAGTAMLSVGLVKRSRLRASVAVGPAAGGTLSARF